MPRTTRHSSDEVWPNFFLVGAAKAGTTSLYSYLRQHPQIFMPATIKEPHFFAQVHPSPKQRYASKAFITDRRDYLRLFRRAAGFKAIGDASPSYLWDAEAPRRIHAVNPDAKILIALRDPVERAYSHYLMDFREGVQHLPFHDALETDWKRKDKGWAISQLYVELGFYAQQVARYLKVFGPHSVHIVLFDELQELARGERRVLADILRFLDLDLTPLPAINTARIRNGFAAPRAEWARRLAGARWARWVGLRVVPLRIGAFIFNRFFLKPATPPPMDCRSKRWLASIYKPEVESLEGLLGRRLPELRRSWATDSGLH